ncbi:MAG: SMC-Scp complex subunit ScpB [Planctomycetota bacterium]
MVLAADDNDPSADSGEAGLGFDDIELAYRQALDALEAAEEQLGSVLGDLAESSQPADDVTVPGADGLALSSRLADELQQTADRTEAASQAVLVEGVRRVTPREVIEAAIFVGGDVALTARRLASLIGHDVDSRVAVSLIDQLNQVYSREQRPYEIRLQEGGYRLELREEYQEVSARTFGLGPRDVRLSPDALEVLAFVAWNQPVDAESLKVIDRPALQGILRQLIRLQLVRIQRTGSRRSDITWETTPKFLQLFGLKSLADLPTSDVFSFK